MNKLLIILPAFFVFSIFHANGQDTWKLLVNKKVIVQGNSEQENITGVFKSASLKKSDAFTLQYATQNSSFKWKRTFYINENNSTNLQTTTLNNQSGIISINATVVKNAIQKNQPLFIYTMSLPKDRAKAAAIRVRRLLLCRIDWN